MTFRPAHGMYPGDNDVFTPFPSRRSVVHSTKGIVSTVSPLASQAGLEVLREGGNAADAAIAAAAVLNLVDPAMTGIGGDAFCLYYEAATQKVHALNGSGRSARGATLERTCRALGIDEETRASNPMAAIPLDSIHAVTVPGAAAAWVDIVARWGSGEVGLERVLAPAVRMAEEGVAVGEISSHCWAAKEAELRSKPNGTDLLKRDPKAPGGYRAPRAGEIIKNPLLAKTLRLLGEKGKQGFYDGPVAEAIVAISQQLGGFLTLEDLQAHDSEVVDPVAITLEFEGQQGPLDLWEHPPNGQGVIAQMALGILAELEKGGQIPEFKPEDHNSVPYLHALIQALRIAFADGTWHISDPAHAVSPAQLLSKPYLAARAKLFHPTDAGSTLPRPGNPSAPPPPLHGLHKTSDTVYLCVTDPAGNACSLVNSVADTFGSRVVPPGVGFVLQSRGAGFHLGPRQHPNLLAAGKRPYNTIIPALTTTPHPDKGGRRLHAALGVMGGAMQPQGHVQVLLNMVRFGMNPQTALDAPRVCIGVSIPGKATDQSKAVDETVYVEEGIRECVVRGLEEMGYAVRVVQGMARALFGRGQVVRVHYGGDEEEEEDGGGGRVYSAGSDGRGDGCAAPLL